MLIHPPDATRCEAALEDAASSASPSLCEEGDWLAEADSLFRDIDGSAVRHLAAACRQRGSEVQAR